MREIVLFCLGSAVVLAVVAAPILALIAWLRARRLSRAVEELQREVRGLRAGLPGRRGETPETSRPEPLVTPLEPVVQDAPSPVVAARVEVAARPEPVGVGPAGAQAPPPAQGFTGRLRRRLEDLAPGARAARPRRSAVDWERWVGVRGAAVVGGIFLALAAIFFFKHAFTQGWISPELRVAGGAAAGLAAIGAAWRLRRRGFGWAPSALEGAGVVALYAAVWAADKRYQLLSTAASFPLMALVTALACALALRHGSFFSALLGLLGGFATPLLLASGQDRPLSLFGYLLLLDLGLVLVGMRRRWPSIGLLALLGTFVMQGLWIVFRMEERLTLGLLIVGAFALVFVLAGALMKSEERPRWLKTQALAVFFPFTFALYFAGRLELGAHVWPTALLLALLFVAAVVTGRLQGKLAIPQGAAIGSVAVVAVWFLRIPRTGTALWELSLVALGLAALAHAAAEWERRARPAEQALREAAAVAGVGWLLLVLWGTASQRHEGFTPLFSGLVGLALLLLRQAALLGRGAFSLPAALGLGLGLALTHSGYGSALGDATLPDPRLFWVLPPSFALGFLFLLPRAAPRLARAAHHGAGALLGIFVALATLESSGRTPGYWAAWPWLPPAAAPVVGALVLLAAARLGSSPWVAGSVLVTAVLTWHGWATIAGNSPPRSEETLLAVLAAAAAGPALVLVLASSLPSLRERRWAWVFLAALVPLSFPVVAALFVERFGARVEAGGYLLIAAPAALSALRLRAAGAPRHAVAWVAGAGWLALSSGVADQLDHEEFAVSCALMALGVAGLARALVLPAAGWTASALSALATLVLLVVALDGWHYERSEHLLLHWISYAHLVPAACIAGVVWLLGGAPSGARRFAALYRGKPALCVIALLFLWLNFVIENAYSHEERLTIGSRALAPEDIHARDLVTSLAWGLYAIVLLVLGTARKVSALRWASLAFFVLSIGKVFLYDLGHLEGLYRVVSLAGLALSLIAVSLFYQRFVFARAPETSAASG